MADEPKRKRFKITRGEDDYMPGNIIKIDLCNFMTFTKLTCKPCSRLNLVIGPNGSGKSSLVCAIALGLAGEPQLLGRATSVGAYVKRGEESGYVNICLRGENKDDVISITRKIDARNKSEWLFNGRVVGKKDIIDVIQKFNIQVNNLTQFLPQDRVCEFAKLTPIQLLEETEKAVGDPQLPVQHRTLIEKSQELKRLERTVESNKGSLEQLKALNAELERDVERVRQREGLLAKAESMKKKLPWLKYDIKKLEYMEAKKREHEAQTRLEAATYSMRVLTEPIQEKKREKEDQETKRKKINDLLVGNMKDRIKLLEEDNRLGVLIHGNYKEINELRNQEKSRQERICKAKEDIAAAELELSNLPPCEVPKHKMEQLRDQITELEETANDMRSQKTEREKNLYKLNLSLSQCKNRLANLENVNTKRLEALKSSGAEKIFEAYEWVKKHSNEFNKDIYGPVLLEVNVGDHNHADYLEGQVANYMWKAFITQDQHDRDLLFRSLESYRVPVINYLDRGCHREVFQPNHDMEALGITTRLDQVFEAPDAVRDLLIDQFSLNNSYVGSRETDRKADQVQRLGIMNLWTPENHYSWSRSRYGNHVSANVNPVQDSRLLLGGLDSGEIEKCKSKKLQLEDEIYSIESGMKDLLVALRKKEDEARGLHRIREDITLDTVNKKKKKSNMELLVNQRRKKLKNIEEEDDPDRAIAKLVEKVKKFKMDRFHGALKIRKLLIEAVAYRRKYAEDSFCSFELEAKIKEMESNVKEQEKIATQALQNLELYKNETKNKKQQMSTAMELAQSNAPLTDELKRAFLEMPTTVEELQAAIQDTISEANSILFLNANILDEYEDRQSKIEVLKDKHDSDKKKFDSLTVDINTLKECWLPKLRSLVTRINETFSRNFQEMAVAGEVTLDERDMDFDQYGILIKVKFRQAGQLQVLSAHHQSGGERSVSTILYLISLQDLTNCPFRVVDEINQGMDPINERNMFQQLVRAASQPNTPQCFLLTPKLLPNLEYSDACSILNVMNGPWIERPSQVWSGGESWGSVSASIQENRS